MTSEFPTLCAACKRLRDPDVGRCTSFPDGIPEGIFVFGHDHRRSIMGEKPFELAPDRREELDLWLVWAGINDRNPAA
jgi:hypothetical protein